MTLTDLSNQWRGATVLVLGDALLDGWYVGSPRQLCREAPVPVVGVDQVSYACGGAANTAANIAALGGRAVLAAAIGEDADGARLRTRLRGAWVDARLVTVPARRTVAKRRVIADDQILVRFDQGDTAPLPAAATEELIRFAVYSLDARPDAVVVCDYDAGTLGEEIRALLRARRADVPLLVVDAHDPLRWASVRPDLVTPNFDEARRLIGPDPVAPTAARPEWVVAAADRLLTGAQAAAMAVTLDTDGAMVVRTGAPAHRTYARPAPPSRTAGAGDAYVAAFTLALTTGAPLTAAAEVAQLAATVATHTAATRTAGTAVCAAGDLVSAGDAGDSRVLDGAALALQVAAHRAHGRKIVFTNGCFDMLHSGHVGYLEQAKRLGDVLIVAVNSDDSVRRLKGLNRPVNPIEDRVAVLSALSSVDHVVVFEEDSPSALITEVRPDVYVKGGDYRPELIPEAPLVLQLGGEVRTVEYLPDKSTSKIIERIRAGRSHAPSGSPATGSPATGSPATEE